MERTRLSKTAKKTRSRRRLDPQTTQDRRRLRFDVQDEDGNRETREIFLRLNTKLDANLVESFANLVRRGLPFDGVCDYLGICSTTYYSWMRRGKDYLESGCEPENDAIYGLFVQETKRALADYRLQRLDRLHTNDNWVRELAILERRDRPSFSKYEQQGGATEDFDPDERFL